MAAPLILSKLLTRLSQFAPDDAPRAVVELEENVGRALDSLGTRVPMLRGREYSVSLVAGSSVTVRHGLGFVPNRFLITYSTADVGAYASVPPGFTAETATLNAVGTGTSAARVRFWREP